MKNNKQKNILQAPKGMRDILPEEYIYYANVYEKAEEIASYYGFHPIQTPHLEKIEIFTGALGETSDIVEKQMYTLKTRGGDHLALRPEGTAPVMRAYIEHGMFTRPQPQMLQYKGSFFRHERPQKGRFRELQQFGLEIIGEESPAAEATVIKALAVILEELKITPFTVHINSLGDKECKSAYKKELLSYYRKKSGKVCDDCKRRMKENPLRLLDCKDEKCAEIKKDAPQMLDYLCDPCSKHFKEVLEFLDATEVPYFLDNHLVRGLDYYSRTVFEFFPENTQSKPDEQENSENKEKKSASAIASGGRYDYLAKTMSRKDFPAAGGAMGIERVIQVMKEKGVRIKPKKEPKVFFIQLGQDAKHKSFSIIEMFRKAHLPLSQSISKDNLRSQLKIASKLKIPYALILGQKEVIDGTIIIKDMESMEQETVPYEKVIEFIKKKLK